MDVKNVERIYALTWLQKGMLRFHLENPEYHFQQYVIELNGEIKSSLLEESFQALVQSYDVLRCNILYEKIEQPVHVVQKVRDVKITYLDISECSDREARLQEIIHDDRNRKFDISKGQLLRITLVRLAEKKYKMIISYHHIIIDGWSLTIVISRLFQYYNELCEKGRIKIVSGPSFQTYVDDVYQKEEKCFAYWKNYLKDYQNDTVLEEAQYSQKQGKKKASITLSEEDRKKVELIQSECGVTTNILLKTIIGIVIQRYMNANDIVFGEVNSGRGWNYETTENIVGMLINVLPCRITSREEQTFCDLVRSIQKQAVESNQYYGVDMVQLQNKLFHGKTLVHFLYNFSNHLKDITIADSGSDSLNLGFCIGEVSLKNLETSELCMDINSYEALTITLTYSEKKYSEAFANHFLNHIMRVLAQIEENTNILVRDIKLTSEEEENRILTCFNREKAGLLHKSGVSDLLELSSRMYHEKVALIHEDMQMTYGELNAYANSFAEKLLASGVSSESKVGVFMKKSFDLFIALYALIKLHAVYIPIDTEYPESRVEHMIALSGMDYIIVSENIICSHRREKQIACNYVSLEKKEQNEVYPRKHEQICILFTSGTTGVPNGVILSDKNIVNYIFNVQTFMKIGYDDVVLQQSSVGFDVFIEETYSALISGGSLVIVDKKTLYDNSKMVNIINNNKVTVVSCSPRYLGVLNNDDLPNVRLFISGGEKLLSKYYNNLIKYAKVFNTYGPTETTVCATYHECQESEEGNIPIGYPIYNSKVYLLDQYRNLQPLNVKGEIYIGGAGVTEPLNEDHAKRFIDNPFGEGKLFRSGDIGKWTQDGNILYCDRNDRQIKLRGYRIEQSEIENAILKYSGVEDCFVTVNSKDELQTQYLVAFIKSEREIDKVAIMSFLKEHIPYYMIPQKYIVRKEFELNANSKIDETELMKHVNAAASINSYNLSATEKELVRIWAKVLGKDESEIGPYDNFFELGGDSILLIRLYSLINDKYCGKSVITDSFIFQNLRDYAHYLDSKAETYDMSAHIVWQEISGKYLVSQTRYINDHLYRAGIPDKLLNKILEQKRFQEITYSDMYKIILVLALYRLLGKDSIRLNRISGDTNEFSTYNFDLRKLHDETDIYHSFCKPAYRAQIQDDNDVRIHKNASCISVVVCERFQQNHLHFIKQFDLCIFFSKEKGQVVMNCKQHSAKLSDTFAQDLLKAYGTIIRRMSDESTDDVEERN